jgi:hypothetical protein
LKLVKTDVISIALDEVAHEVTKDIWTTFFVSEDDEP